MTRTKFYILPCSLFVAAASASGATRWVHAGDAGTPREATPLQMSVRVTTAPITNWTCVASSADGTRLVAVNAGNLNGVVGDNFTGQIYTSTDSGTTWNLTSAPGEYWNRVVSSADGKRLAAHGRKVYGSVNSGAIWTPIGSADWNSDYAPDFGGLACSADGIRLVAVSAGTRAHGEYIFGGPIYRSGDFGMSWATTSAPDQGWLSVASSADGTKLVAVAGVDSSNIGGTDGGPIYTSNDSGTTWHPANAPIARWFCVASSADGNKLAAGAYSDAPGGGIYVSSNGGRDWTLTSAPTSEGWVSIASSADGTKLVAASGSVYFSADSGATWVRIDAPIQLWGSVACSVDGSKIVASVWSGPIYTFSVQIAVVDHDGDGVPDSQDLCPETPAGAIVDAHGCSIEQLVSCVGPRSGGLWTNHGQYVSAVAKTAKAFVLAELITEEQAHAAIRAAAKSTCGKK